MKIPFYLKNLLAAVTIVSTIGTTLAETEVVLDYQETAQRSEGDVIAGESYLQSHRVSGSGDFYLSENMSDNTTSLDLTTTNIWLETEGELRLSGVNISNSVQKTELGYTATNYGILVADGKVVIDNIDTGDLQANLSIGTALGDKEAELVISGGAKVTTSAVYNTIGANGSQGTISVSGTGTTFNTQQITLGSSQSLHANKKQTLTGTGGAMTLNGVQALVSDTAWEDETADGESEGYGIINISGGAAMHVGEGNTNGTSSNKLQIVNGQINVDGSGSELVMHDNAVISMTCGYEDNAQPDISAGLSVTNGGVVRNEEGTKINDFTIGNLFGSHNVTSTLSADGTGSAVKLDVYGYVNLGFKQASGTGNNNVSLHATNNGQIALSADGWCLMGFAAKGTEDTSNYNISVVAESGGSVQLAAATVGIGGYYAENSSNGNIVLKASGASEEQTSSLDIRATGNMYLNKAKSSDLSISLVAESGATLSLQAGKNINFYGNTQASITDNGSLLKTTGNVRLYDTASVSIGSGAAWESTGAVTLSDSASLILSEGASVKADSITIGEGASLSSLSDDTAEAALVFGIDADEASLLTPVATIDADLILQDGALVTLNGGPIDMNGHSLTMGNNISITLSGDAYNSDEYVLFTNLGNTGAEDVEFELTVNGQKTTAVYSGNAVVVNAASVPEPTSATLSLLALAGLVMRRRRK